MPRPMALSMVVMWETRTLRSSAWIALSTLVWSDTGSLAVRTTNDILVSESSLDSVAESRLGAIAWACDEGRPSPGEPSHHLGFDRF